MRSQYFLASERLGFRAWHKEDLPLAMELWTDVRVTGLLGGPYTPDRICDRLEREMAAQIEFGMQYWPIFLLAGGRHVGVCGLRPWRIEEKIPELGYHLRPEFWRQGFYPHPLGHPLDSLLGGLRDAERAYEKTTTGRPCSVDSLLALWWR